MPHVTFIHGIANKPPADQLIEIWRRSLSQNDGINLGTKGIKVSDPPGFLRITRDVNKGLNKDQKARENWKKYGYAEALERAISEFKDE